MQENWAEIGRRVAAVRAEYRLTQRQLAEQLGITQRALSELERGRVLRPSGKLTDAVRRVLQAENLNRAIVPGPTQTHPSLKEVAAVRRDVDQLAKTASPEHFRRVARLVRDALQFAEYEQTLAKQSKQQQQWQQQHERSMRPTHPNPSPSRLQENAQ